MLLALTRESSLHSTVRLGWDEFSLDAPDALLFTSSRSQKTLLSVFLSSVLLSLYVGTTYRALCAAFKRGAIIYSS